MCPLSGDPFVFISMPYGDDFKGVAHRISHAVQNQGWRPYLVRDEAMAVPIVDTIGRMIRDCRLFIADVTGGNPNVLHELGQAQALDKPVIMISQTPPDGSPFMIRGQVIHNYHLSSLDELTLSLAKIIPKETTPTDTLRSMLVPASLVKPSQESKFVIAASPLSFRRSRGNGGGYPKLRRTYSDYVGVRAILQAFGSLYDFDTLPDLIDPEDFKDSALKQPMTLYCIASPKANRWTGTFLQAYHFLFTPRLSFRPDPDARNDNLRNVRVSIHRNNGLYQPDRWPVPSDQDRYYHDYGVIVRGPNPWFKDQMVVILAGRSSLGTEAACRAFTDKQMIDEIRQRLTGFKMSIEDHRDAFWALVKMDREEDDGQEEAIPSSLELCEVGQFSRISKRDWDALSAAAIGNPIPFEIPDYWS